MNMLNAPTISPTFYDMTLKLVGAFATIVYDQSHYVQWSKEKILVIASI